MRNVLIAVLFSLALVGCENGSKGDQAHLSSSSGNINNLSVIMDDDLWKGEVGEALRTNFAAPVDGLPQEEPLFSINQMPPESFSGFVRKNRIFLRVEKGKDSGTQVAENPYARPQTGVLITGQTNDEIIDQIDQYSQRVINAFKKTEIKENQRRIKKSLMDDSRLEEELGVSLNFSTAYRYAKEREDFFWIRKDIPNGSMEITVYEVPMNTILKDTNIIGNIIKMRDSIGEAYIPGPVENTYMITEEAYAPYLFETEIDGKFAYETRGTWEVKGYFMAGPFLNYAVLDEENERFVILEGFVFAPSARKRDNMFEVEAILRSAKIK